MLLDLFHKKPTVKDGSQSFQFSRGVVKFNSVRFSYDGKKDIIQDFNLQAEPGQKIALIGETGGGKSTILKLLFRFYDVKEGTIMVDDQDIRSVTLGSLRQHIGVVPQDPSLFNDSIVNNVRYARLTATDEEVIAACKGAAIHDKITTFTDGYATKVGENGVKLSGGELQRIAIARVILQNPEIILLDEATSSVDTETEAKIQDALQVLTKGRTTFTVAHRLSTVISADIILVIKDGMIAEQGSPHDLLKAKGKYFALWTKQFGINSPPSDDELKPAILIELPDAAHNKDNKDSSESASSGTKSLRADAPEFIPHKDLVPHKQRGTAAEGGEPSHERSESGHQQGYDSVDAKKGGNQMEQNQKSKASVDELEPMSNSILSDSRPTVSDSKHGSASQTDSKKKQYIPFQRGGNKKSEPSGSGLKHNQHEGPSDDAGENSATSIKSLRVSAPTDPSSGPNSAHGVNRGQSRRRHRTARVKKAAQSEATSGEGSRAGSSSSLYFPATNEPSTTSTVLAGTSAASLSDAVQFTPGK